MAENRATRIVLAGPVVVSEMAGTALLVSVGLSLVILMFGEGSPIAAALPSEGRIRPFTPAMFPLLYAVMVYVESPISGISTNPARSLGPAIVSGQWDGWWIYWVGPAIGSIAACLVCSGLARRITVAKLYHFDSDRDRLFRRGEPAKFQEKGENATWADC